MKGEQKQLSYMRGDCEAQKNKDGEEICKKQKPGRDLKSLQEGFHLRTVDFNNLKGIIILMYF